MVNRNGIKPLGLVLLAELERRLLEPLQLEVLERRQALVLELELELELQKFQQFLKKPDIRQRHNLKQNRKSYSLKLCRKSCNRLKQQQNRMSCNLKMCHSLSMS
jgi:hypothetical protein